MRSALRYLLMRTALRGLQVSGAHRWLAPLAQGQGLIFMLHQVCPTLTPRTGRSFDLTFDPNGILRITPVFLDQVLAHLRALGIDIVNLDVAAERLSDPDDHRRFVCFTLDDGYRDNLIHAVPVFQKYQAPYTIYVPSDFPSGNGELWWLALEQIIKSADSVKVPSMAPDDLGGRVFACETTAQKWAVYERLYKPLRLMSEVRQRRVIRSLAAQHGCDLEALCKSQIMNWDEIRDVMKDPLATIGAHTAGHYAVGKLADLRARTELSTGIDVLEEKLGERPRHLSYPYGDAQSAGPRDFQMAKTLGMQTAVTTRKGVLFKDHAKHLTALPRVSLNGELQSPAFTDVYLSGAPFALSNRFRKLNIG